MLKKSAVENILAAALESGADFAEIYAERTKRSSIAMVNGKVETALGGMDYGAGVSCRKACPSRERRSSSDWQRRRQGHITMPLRRQG